jgi:hypothetical protein
LPLLGRPSAFAAAIKKYKLAHIYSSLIWYC